MIISGKINEVIKRLESLKRKYFFCGTLYDLKCQIEHDRRALAYMDRVCRQAKS